MARHKKNEPNATRTGANSGEESVSESKEYAAKKMKVLVEKHEAKLNKKSPVQYRTLSQIR